MFARFFGSSNATKKTTSSDALPPAAPSTTQSSVNSNPSNSVDSDEGEEEGANGNGEGIVSNMPPPPPPEPDLNFEVQIQIGGGKGWPPDVTVVYYHRLQGLVCLGTEGGAIYACGDGFQYMRPWLTADSNPVISLTAPTSYYLLAAYADNSLAVFDVPNLNVVDLLPGTWLNKQAGDITFIHVDEPAEKQFVYIGTSRGCVYILEVRDSIRICEYMLAPGDLGLTQPMAVAEIQICPKDEKYIAIGLSGGDKSTGMVVIFNFLKHKIKMTHNTGAVTSLTWAHTGDVCYIGTRLGSLFVANYEKHTCVEFWNSSGEAEESDVRPTIRRLVWYPQQTPTDEPCLFVGLGDDGDLGVSLKSVIVALAPIGAHGDMDQVFSLSPLVGEDIVGFRLVATIDKHPAIDTPLRPIPGLLILTKSTDDESPSSARKCLKILRCPSGAMEEWQLESADLPAPRLANEVLPGKSDVSSLSVMLPPSLTSSLSSLLVRTANSAAFMSDVIEDDGASEAVVAGATPQTGSHRRFSARDFLDNADDAMLSVECNWQIVLAAASADDFDSAKSERQDVLLLGHQDGLVIAWGVFLPELGRERGAGNRYIPLRSLRVGRCEVSCISHCNDNGLLAAGDIAGTVVVWEVFDDASGDGSCARLRRARTVAQFKAAASAASAVSGEAVAEEEEEDIESSFLPNNIREAFRYQVGSKVTALAIISDATIVVVGTSSGTLHVSSNFSASEVRNIDLGKMTDRSAIAGLHYGPFYYQGAVRPCIFATMVTGYIAVICLRTHALIAWNCGPASFEDEDSREISERRVAVCCVVNGYFIPATRPDPTSLGSDANRAVSATTSPEATKRSSTSYRLFGSSSPDTTGAVAASEAPNRANARSSIFSRSSSVPAPSTISIPDHLPRYFMVILGGCLLTYDLAKFSIVPNGGKDFTALHTDAVGSQTISSHTIISGAIVSYVEDASRAWATPVPCFTCVDTNGALTLMSVRSRRAICHANLLEGVTDVPAMLKSGVMLGSGNCYMLQNECMLFSSTVCCTTHILPKNCPLPARIATEHCAPERSFILKTGREQTVAASKIAVTKRRNTMIALTSGPTDLEKIFAKTRSETQKDALFAAGNPVRETKTATAQRSAANTKDELAELGDALADRGERLNRLAMKMDAFKEMASEYRAQAQDAQRQLQSKSDAWGLGMF